jgi:hypothetical protein
MSFSVSILHRVYGAYCYLLVRTIVALFPARLWYRVLYNICFQQGKLLHSALALTPFRRNYRYRIMVSWLTESALWRLIALGRPFPIPIRDKNMKALLDARRDSKAVALCSVHMPLIRLVLRRLVELGLPPTAVVAQEAAINGRMPVWGMTESLPGLIADRTVLFKVRTILRQGGLLATLVDANLGDPPNCNVFRLIRSVNARVVFFTTELQRGGEIVVEFFAPPDPLCLSDESVQSNLLELQSKADRILRLPPGRSTATTLSMKNGIPKLKSQAVELDSSS